MLVLEYSTLQNEQTNQSTKNISKSNASRIGQSFHKTNKLEGYMMILALWMGIKSVPLAYF